MDTDKLKLDLNSEDSRVRNEAALAIMDLGYEKGLALLKNAVLCPRDERNYGTLVYAMSGFDCEPYVDVIIELMQRDSYEVFNIATDILIAQWAGFSQETKRMIDSKIKEIIKEPSSCDESDFFKLVQESLGLD